MEDFVKIKNPYIPKNSSLKMKKVPADEVIFTGNVYGQTKLLPVSKEQENLSSTFFKIDITISQTEALGIIGASTLALNLFDIHLVNKKGLSINHIEPCYGRMKYNELLGKPIQSSVTNSITPQTTFYVAPTTDLTTTIYYPVPFFYCQKTELFGGEYSFLNVRQLEDLFYRITVSPKTEVGLKLNDVSPYVTDIRITNIKVSLVQESFNDTLSTKNEFFNNSVRNVPRSIKNSFDVFYEDVQDIAIGATSHKMLLRCPYPAMNFTAMVYNNVSEYEVSTFELQIKNNKIVQSSSRKTNYALYDQNTSWSANKELTYWFNKKNSALSDSGYLTFSPEDSLYPAYLTVFFTAPAIANTRLYVFEEILTDFKIADRGGIIGQNNTDSVLGTSNSTTLPTSITQV